MHLKYSCNKRDGFQCACGAAVRFFLWAPFSSLSRLGQEGGGRAFTPDCIWAENSKYHIEWPAWEPRASFRHSSESLRWVDICRWLWLFEFLILSTAWIRVISSFRVIISTRNSPSYWIDMLRWLTSIRWDALWRQKLLVLRCKLRSWVVCQIVLLEKDLLSFVRGRSDSLIDHGRDPWNLHFVGMRWLLFRILFCRFLLAVNLLSCHQHTRIGDYSGIKIDSIKFCSRRKIKPRFFRRKWTNRGHRSTPPPLICNYSTFRWIAPLFLSLTLWGRNYCIRWRGGGLQQEPLSESYDVWWLRAGIFVQDHTGVGRRNRTD